MIDESSTIREDAMLVVCFGLCFGRFRAFFFFLFWCCQSLPMHIGGTDILLDTTSDNLSFIDPDRRYLRIATSHDSNK